MLRTSSADRTGRSWWLRLHEDLHKLSRSINFPTTSLLSSCAGRIAGSDSAIGSFTASLRLLPFGAIVTAGESGLGITRSIAFTGSLANAIFLPACEPVRNLRINIPALRVCNLRLTITKLQPTFNHQLPTNTSTRQDVNHRYDSRRPSRHGGTQHLSHRRLNI